MSSFRKPYSSRLRVQQSFSLPSLTKQSFAAECDINLIVDRFRRTGVVDHVSSVQPQYLDCLNVTDYSDAIMAVREADDIFAALPSAVRRRFDNDPSLFLAAFEDPSMRDELTELGLLVAPPVVESEIPPPVEPPPADGAST